MFIDEVEIEVVAGRGGDGCMSFRREKFIPKGGPDGGDGGNGGCVVVVAEHGVNSLVALVHRKQWKAESGKAGGGAQRHGGSSPDLTILVPPGTIVTDAKHGFVLKDLAAEGDRVTVAQGGRGGKGNVRFKSSTNRAPREFTRGGEAEARRIKLELKMIADVGLVGKPNAGKSTLLSRLSRARPEIAAYPFTTKYPNLGRVQIDYDRSFIMADIPGLIEGAHDGVGLGHEFLRHIQRAGILIHLVEPSPTDGSDPLDNYRAIRDELGQYDHQLAERTEIVVVTKADLPDAETLREMMVEEFGIEAMVISAVTGEGLNSLLQKIAQVLNPPKAW